MCALAVGFLAGCSSSSDSGVQAKAADPDHVSFNLDGCRMTSDVTLPIDGKFVCPDGIYTSGNLGKVWAELDIVPFRLAASTGASSPASQTYTIALALDNCEKTGAGITGGCATGEDGYPGFDVISPPVLNTALSAGTCSAATYGDQASLHPGVGGVDVTIYRTWTITQPKNTTCVYDFYGRLAMGSHLYTGSSLHADLLNQQFTTSGVGAKEVSIPDVYSQGLSKTMTATQGGSQTWGVSKSADPGTVSFGDVCATDGTDPQSVQVTVTWTKLSVVAGDITAVVNVYADNPAARDLTIDVTDVVFKGAIGAHTDTLGTHDFDAVTLPARATGYLVATWQYTFPAATANIGDYLSDEATAHYVDPVISSPAILGTNVAAYQAQIQQGSVSNATATITDAESMAGTGLDFSVATPTLGSFTGYTAGDETVGPVNWGSGSRSASGSVTFDKTVYIDTARVTTGTLTDSAHLAGSDGFSADSNVLNIPISSNAYTKLTVTKTIPADFLMGTDTATVPFHVTRSGDTTYSHDFQLVFTGGGAVTQSTTLTGLVPDTYVVTEGTIVYSQALYPHLDPTEGLSQSKDLNVSESGLAACSGTLTFTNVPDNLPGAQVKKTTYPAQTSSDDGYTWTFTLTGPGGVNESKTANAGEGYVKFDTELLRPGTYTVTETTKTDWDITSATPHPTPADGTCQFTVAFPANNGTLFSCDFVNTKRAHADVVKTLSGAALAGTDSFEFQLRTGASTSALGTIVETEYANAANGGAFAFTTGLIPGTEYQFCEVVMPGWQTTLLNPFVPGASLPEPDNSVLCVAFTPTPGELVHFTVDNTPPPGGYARTIGFWKNWTSCDGKGNQDPVMDETLASFPVADGQSTNGVFIGDLYVDTCAEAISLLDKRMVSTGAKAAKYPVFALASQLLAAKLNVEAGAATCTVADTAMSDGQALLDTLGFNGNGPITVSKANATLLRNYAATLDAYNNNLLCH